MHIFKGNRVKSWYFHFYRRQLSVLRNDIGHGTSEDQILNYNFHHMRKYCTGLKILKNQSLAKYYENYRKKFEENEGGRFRGMKREVASKKVQIINNLLNQISNAHENVKSLKELCSGNIMIHILLDVLR